MKPELPKRFPSRDIESRGYGWSDAEVKINEIITYLEAQETSGCQKCDRNAELHRRCPSHQPEGAPTPTRNGCCINCIDHSVDDKDYCAFPSCPCHTPTPQALCKHGFRYGSAGSYCDCKPPTPQPESCCDATYPHTHETPPPTNRTPEETKAGIERLVKIVESNKSDSGWEADAIHHLHVFAGLTRNGREERYDIAQKEYLKFIRTLKQSAEQEGERRGREMAVDYIEKNSDPQMGIASYVLEAARSNQKGV